MANFELKINITASTREELADTLELIQKQVEDGFKTGHDRNDTGSYFYEVIQESEDD